MRSTFLPTADLLEEIRQAFVGIAGWTLDVVAVSLVEGDFDPEDPDSWPAASSHFASKNSGDGPSIILDSDSGAWMLKWPDPESGWNFPATSITDSVTITGYIVKNGTNKIGATKIAPQVITVTDEVVTIPYVSLQLSESFFVEASQPQPI